MTQKEAGESGKLLDQKHKEIMSFYENNFARQPEISFVSSPEAGYSGATKLLQVSMEQFRQLLNEHRVLLDKTYRAISQNEARRNQVEKQLQCSVGFRRMSREANRGLSELVEVAKKDNLDQKYWKARAVIGKYCELCAKQCAPCSKLVAELRTMQEMRGFTDRMAEVISASIECSKVHSELMLCLKMLGKEAGMEECRALVMKPAQLVLMALDVGMSEFHYRGQHSKLRKLMNEHEKYYLGWVENYNPRMDRTLGDSDTVVTGLICACLVMDQPKKAIRFAHLFLENLQKEKYGYKETMFLIIQITTAFAYLYTNQPDKPEDFAEKERRMNEGAELMGMIRNIIRYTVNNNPGIPEEIENLIFLFNSVEGEFHDHHARVRAKYEQARILGDELLKEEDEQARRIHDRLLKREQKRREKEAQRLELEASKAKTPSLETGTVSESKEPAAVETEVRLHPGIQAGVLAYACKQPLNKVLEEFKKVEKDSQASAFDKIQAKYGCADAVAASLQERVVIFKQMAEDVKRYDQAIHSRELPSIESDMAFRKALATYKGSIQELMFDTLRMCQAFKQAWDQFFSQEELQNDFLERLIELHDEMKQLTVDGEEIARCCADIPDIYARRGKMIQTRGLSRRGNPERRRVMAENVRSLETDSEQVRNSFQHLKQTINIEMLNKASEQKQATVSVITEESVSEPLVPEVLVSAHEIVSPPVQPLTYVESVPVEAQVSATVISIPVLPPGLAREVQQKTGRTVSASEPGTDVAVKTTGFQSQQWLPDSGCEPHPLSLLAQHLGNSLVVTTSQKRWYIAPGTPPVDADSVAIPKRSLKLDYDVSVSGSSVIQPTAVEESVQPSDVSESAPVSAVTSLAPSLELPLQSLLPRDIGTALMRSLTDTGENWEATATGLKKKTKEWTTVKPGKKSNKGKKGKSKEVAPPSNLKPSEKTKMTILNLQGLLRKQLRLFMDNPEYCKRHLPSGFNIDGVIKRACEGLLFRDNSRLHEDFCLLSKALNIPLKVAFRVSDVFGYRPDMDFPVKLGLHGVLEDDHLTLESYAFSGKDYWFASMAHYFELGDDQDEADIARKEEQAKEDAERKTKQKEMKKAKSAASKPSRSSE